MAVLGQPACSRPTGEKRLYRRFTASQQQRSAKPIALAPCTALCPRATTLSAHVEIEAIASALSNAGGVMF